MLEELESADVSTNMVIEKITDPIVNAGQAGRDKYLKQQRERRPYLPKEEYIKQQREKRAQDRTHAPRKDCTCEACGYSTRELHKMLNDLHTGNPKECPLRGPKFNKDKQTRERLNQYNLKNKDDKRVDVSEERLHTPPQRPTIPKTNHVNVVQNLDDNHDHEMDIKDEDYNTGDEDGDDTYKYEDEIENEHYGEEGMLPQPNVSSLRTLRNTTISRPTVNHGKMRSANPRENMNIISSFRMKQE